MSLEAALYDYLAGDAGVLAVLGQGGSPASIALYFGAAAQSVKPPYAVFARVGGSSGATLTGASIVNSRVQIDAYAATAGAARDVANAINDALDGVAVVLPGLGRLAATRINVADMPEPDVRLYRRMQEFSIWHPET